MAMKKQLVSIVNMMNRLNNVERVKEDVWKKTFVLYADSVLRYQ